MNQKAIAIIAAGILILGGLFVWMTPGPESELRTASVVPGASQGNSTTPVEIVAEFIVRDGTRFSGPSLIQAFQGQHLRLRVTADSKDEMHLHGYDLSAPLEPGEVTELHLPLTLSGRFELELHHAQGAIAVLEVQPQHR